MIKDFVVNLEDFQIDKYIDEGNCSSVFLVRLKETSKLYAAKVYKIEYEDNADQKMLADEISAHIKAKHPAILPLYGFSEKNFENNNYPTIITKYMPNGSLKDYFKKSDVVSSSKNYIILLGIAEGMKYLHSCKIIHLDLKPGNVLLDENFYPYISDFGLSKISEYSLSKNFFESFAGTPSYMAPEIISDIPYTYKVDVYSFSIIAYEIITGKNPYPDAQNVFKLLIDVEKGKRPNINSIKDDYIKSLLSKWWSPDPEERPTFDIIIEEIKKESFKKFMNAKKEDVEKYMRFLNGVEEPKKTDKSPRTSQSPQSLIMKAESGDAQAQFSLGCCYSLGEGVIQDKKKAFEYYMMAAEQGHIKAQYLVASSYSYGKGIEQDKKKAFEFYLKAAEQGCDKGSQILLVSMKYNL
ncbi:hypothetical protein M9Y10_024227 [Tritrichomonas musculus]|uniref:Protein kinase domain-containing protein n=1 Tax=Tritrichomonas musculus TaxID=1915356 RepID=A0ABR2HE89_9EUKA